MYILLFIIQDNDEYFERKNETFFAKKVSLGNYSKNLFSFIKSAEFILFSSESIYSNGFPNKRLPSIICFKASNNHSYNHSLLLQPICVLLLYSIPPNVETHTCYIEFGKKKLQIDIEYEIHFLMDFLFST